MLDRVQIPQDEVEIFFLGGGKWWPIVNLEGHSAIRCALCKNG